MMASPSNPESNRNRDSGASPISDDLAVQILSRSMRGARRPVDDLIEQMQTTPAGEWFNEAIRTNLTSDDLEAMASGTMSIEEMINRKETSKTSLAEASTRADALAALACYCLVIACAAARHQHLISSRAGAEWSDVFEELAENAGTPWKKIFEDAAVEALRLDEAGDES